MGECKQCGLCCKTIPMPCDQDFYKEAAEDNPKGVEAFIYKNWEPITSEEALAINPYLREVEKKTFPRSWHYYSCRLLEDNKCLVHCDKPYMCREYPWYDMPPQAEINFYRLYVKDCGFQEDWAQIKEV